MSPEQHGQQIFKRELCTGCHADGNNALIPDRPIKGKAFANRFAQDQMIESVVRKGFPASGMPSFGKDRINDQEMKDLILYIRSFTPNGR